MELLSILLASVKQTEVLKVCLDMVFGLYGKREAEPSYGYGVAIHPYGISKTDRSPQGLPGYGIGLYGKRDAEPGYGYGGYGAASVSVSQFDHGYGYNPQSYSYGYNIGSYGKRDAEPGYGIGFIGYGLAATSFHPYGGSSSNYRTTQGLTSYGYYGYGKRSAEPGYGISVAIPATGFSAVQQSRPYYHGSYGYNINHVYGKRSAEPGYLFGINTSQQYVSKPYSSYGVNVAHPY